jgi:hypothetical protein
MDSSVGVSDEEYALRISAARPPNRQVNPFSDATEY